MKKATAVEMHEIGEKDLKTYRKLVLFICSIAFHHVLRQTRINRINSRFSKNGKTPEGLHESQKTIRFPVEISL